MSNFSKVYADEPDESLHAVRFYGTHKVLCDAGYSGTVENDIANARRISACWNACAGIATEALEIVNLKKLHEDAAMRELDLTVRVTELQGEWDALIELLKTVRHFVASSHEPVGGELNDIDAAIAKVKGGAA